MRSILQQEIDRFSFRENFNYFLQVWGLLTVFFFMNLIVNAENVMGTKNFVYVSSSEGSDGSGIYCASFNKTTGEIGEFRLVAKLENVGFMTILSNKKYLFAATEEDSDGISKGYIAAYVINGITGELKLINKEETGTGLPTFISISEDGEYLLTVSYSGAAGSVLKINDNGFLRWGGSLFKFSGSGKNASRQSKSHPHSINFDPGNHYIIVCDLGADQLVRFKCNYKLEKLVLQESSIKSFIPGAGPRHLCFSKDGRFVYVVNELDNTVSVHKYSSVTGQLDLIQIISTLSNSISNSSSQLAAEIRIHPNKPYLYVSNRSIKNEGFDGITIYHRNSKNGKLEFIDIIESGKHPRYFDIDNDGHWLILSARDSNYIQIYKIDEKTGIIKNHSYLSKLQKPLSIQLFCNNVQK